MPCRTEDWGDDTKEEKEIQKLTRMLCSACVGLETKGWDMPTLELKKWWEKHQKEDERRLAMERAERKKNRLRKQAISKLTPEERKALGL